MIVNAVFWLAVIGGVVWLVIWAARRSGSGQASSHPVGVQPAGNSAKETAQMRYARGEITREQYQQLLDDLSQ
ncbi:MAG TPA: SHOCT domain-containing protein [Anaerolineaceae bacterium]|nr:SHOCT domain-containing protein [Anaerolineaceae bacterium]